MKQTLHSLQTLLSDVKFREWDFHVYETGDRFYLQLSFIADDCDDGIPVILKTRKWLLSSHMTNSEVIQTALKAVLTALEHEAREQFTYKGRQIFGPHLDLDALVEIADRRDVRV